MAEKESKGQGPGRRKPRQARSRYKVELMFEAAIELLDEGGPAALTTNAVAARAGVSIGTLYQYYDDKHALLDALAARELSSMSEKLIDSIRGEAPAEPGGRLRATVRAVTGSYGGRGRVHRMLIEHSLTRGTAGRLSPMYAMLVALFSSQGVSVGGVGPSARKLTPAQAFVLTHAVGGVLRALVADEKTPPRREIEDALVRMGAGFFSGLQPERAAGQ